MAEQTQTGGKSGAAEHESARHGDRTAGQETYPGPRRSEPNGAGEHRHSGGDGDATADSRATGGNVEPGNETGLSADTPTAGDVDPGSTRSAEETGQDGDPDERKKSTAHAWNG